MTYVGMAHLELTDCFLTSPYLHFVIIFTFHMTVLTGMSTTWLLHITGADDTACKWHFWKTLFFKKRGLI